MSTTQTERRTAPGVSKAEQSKPSADRVKELAEEGITEQRQVAGVLHAEHYNINEIAKAMGLGNMKEVLALVKKQTEKPGKVIKRQGDSTPGLAQNPPPETSDDISEGGSVLQDLLETTAGIAPQRASKLVTRYERRKDIYDANPMKIYRMMINGGISWIRAQNVTQEFVEETNPDAGALLPWSAGPGMSGSQQQIDPYAQWSGSGLPTGGPRDFGQRRNEDEEEAEERREQRRMDRQMNRIVMALMVSNLQGKGQGQGMGPYGLMGFNPFMASEFEPILDGEGKVVTDSTGNPVMRYKLTPVQAALGGKGEEGKPDYEPIKILADALSNEREAKSELVTTFANMTKEMSQQQVVMLQDRLNAMEQQDPLDTVDTILTKIQDWGFNRESQSTEIAKMDHDLKRWEHEQNTSLTKWIHEQKMAMEDKKYARQQMHEFNDTLRKGITEIGGPLVETFKGGYLDAKRGGNGKGQPPRQGGGGGKKSLDDMSENELLDLYHQSRQSERVLSDAQNQIVTKMKERGMELPRGQNTT